MVAAHDSGTKTIGCFVDLHWHRPEFLALVVVASSGATMSIQRLRRLLDLSMPDKETHFWLLDGIREWRNGQSMEAALGLTDSLAIEERNRAIQKAAALLSRDLTDWQRAGLLSKRLRLPPRHDGSDLDIALLSVRKLVKFTREMASQRRIYELISNTDDSLDLLSLMPAPVDADNNSDGD